MKKLWKTILILLLIVFLFLLWLFIVRAKRSNELKSWLLREDSNWIIQQVVWGWNDLSINVNWPQTALRIPISSVVPETLTWKNFKFRLNLYDENWEKLDYVFLGEKGIPSWVSHSSVVDLIFKDSILWMKEFKMPVWAISRINEDTFQVELEDFDWYADMAWDDIWYKIFGKWKIDSVYLEIFHWNNVKLEFAIIDDEVIIEDYCEWAECKDSYPWEIEDLYWTYKLVWFNYEITDIPATLTISEKLIWAKFCNDMWSDNYSIGDNYIHVNNMSQTEMLCDSEKLMEYESKFDLSNAKISLVERNLRLTTSNWDIYDFFKNDEELELSEIEKLKQSFEWIVINGKVDENQLSSSQPNTIQFNIEWKNTLYFLDEFWLAFTLWKEWEWWKIENAYEWKYLASVWLKKSWNKTYWFFLIDNEYYHNRQENPEPDEELVWENNKYHIVMRTVKNWGKDWSFDLVVYDVE